MNISAMRLALPVAILSFAVSVFAQPNSSYKLVKGGFVVQAMSADGKTLVGSVSGKPAVFNVSHGLTMLPLTPGNTSGVAVDVDGDGNVVVGADGGTAAVWRRGVLDHIADMQTVTGVSNDGLSFAGLTNLNAVWIGPGGEKTVSLMETGDGYPVAVSGISGDGLIVIGNDDHPNAFAWTPASNAFQPFQETPSRFGHNFATSTTLHGAALYGSIEYTAGGVHGIYWQEFLHNMHIAPLSQPARTAVADDNSLASAETLLLTNGAVVPLSKLLQDQGLSGLTATLTNLKVLAISGDGLTIAGTGLDSNTNTVTWLASLGLFGTSETFRMAPNTSLQVAAPGVLSNDAYALGGTAVLDTQASNGNLTLASDGSFTYTPSANFIGRDTFTYRISKSAQTSNPITVVIKVGVPVSLTMSSGVVSGNPVKATVTLNFTAFAATAVTLASSKPSIASVPSSVTVQPGAKSASFMVTTSQVTTSTNVTISAVLSTQPVTANLLVAASSPKSLTISPNSVAGGGPQQARGYVKLWTPAPTGGILVTFTTSDRSIANVPASYSVPAGGTSFSFPISTPNGVSSLTSVTITASGNGSSVSAVLYVRPPSLSSLKLNPTTIISGFHFTATISLDAPAMGAGYSFTLTGLGSNSVPAGKSQVQVSDALSGPDHTVQMSVVVTGQDNATRSQTITINPASITGVKMAPNPAIGGLKETAIPLFDGTPDSTDMVSFQSSNSSVVPPPNQVKAGQNGIIMTTGVDAATQVTFSATYLGVTQSKVLTVNPAVLISLIANPNPIQGGFGATGTVTLQGQAGPSGTRISLSSSNPSVASVPATVKVDPFQSTSNFTVSTSKVSANTPVTISATLGGVTKPYTMTVTP